MKTVKTIPNHLASLGLATLLIVSPQFAAANWEVDVSDAASCIGRVCTVEGLVAGVVTSRDHHTVIKLTSPTSKKAFSAVIMADTGSQFHDLETYQGRKVRITGLVKMHKGSPEATLSHPSQLASAE